MTSHENQEFIYTSNGLLLKETMPISYMHVISQKTSLKGFRCFHLTALELDGLVESVRDWFTVLMWMEKIPPWITALLDNDNWTANHYSGSQKYDGQGDWDEDEAEVPATTLLSSFDMCICCFIETVLLLLKFLTVQFVWVQCHVHLVSGSLSFCCCGFEARHF